MGRGVAITGVTLAVVLGLGVALFSFWRLADDDGSPGIARDASAASLGIVYVMLDARSAPYYGQALDSGALVTEVAPGSAAYRAGVRPGDVILAFNGTRLGNEVTLVGLMLECTLGHESSPHGVEVQLARGECVHQVQLLHESIPD